MTTTASALTAPLTATLTATRYGPALTAGVAPLSAATAAPRAAQVVETLEAARPESLRRAAVEAGLPPAAFGWHRLVLAAAGTMLLVLLAEGLMLRDWPALVLAGLTAAGVAARLRWRRLATAALTLLFLDVGFYTLTGAISNTLEREALGAIAIPAALGACALAGAIGAIGTLLSRDSRRAGGGTAPLVAMGAVALFLLFPLAAATRATADAQALRRPERAAQAPKAARPVTLALRAERMAYAQTRLEAQSGEVMLSLANGDLFWHTFTIEALGVDLKAPVGGTRVLTFNAPPGTYAFYCSVPGHEQLGMRGTLVVR